MKERSQTDDIVLYNRQTGTLEIEQVPGRKLLEFLYGGSLGRRVADLLWCRRIFSRFYGWPLHRRWSRNFIDTFIRQNKIDMTEVEIPADGFQSFNDFFIRRLKPGARPVNQDPQALISPADSRLKVFQLQNTTVLMIKGMSMTLKQLIGSAVPIEPFINGWCLQFRLAPRDYHRFGYLDNGVQGAIHTVPGRLYSVSPLALRHMPAVWGRNFRQWCFLRTEGLGTVLQIEVGATMVGSIVQHQPHGGPCLRGAEKGYFQMGGSTVLVILPPNLVRLDEDILSYSQRNIETLVRYGESIGRVKPYS